MTFFTSLTGVDASTDLDALVRIAESHPGKVEFAVLYSHSRAGRDPRYQEREFAEEFGNMARSSGFMAAVHLCGSAVADFVVGREDVVGLARCFGRIQLNFSAATAPFTLDALDAAIKGHPGFVITQHNEANNEVASAIKAENHHVLFDASLGKGIRTIEWPKPIPGKFCGFAGGIGPDNVGEVIQTLESKIGADQSYWIDMESRLRDADDRFSLEACRAVLEAVTSVEGDRGGRDVC